MGLNNHQEIEAYIEKVCQEVRFRQIHQDVRQELGDHIRDLTEEYLSQGFTEGEAGQKALAQMGDAGTVGKQLNQVHRPKPDWSVLLFTFLFTGLGLLAMYLIQKQDLNTYDLHVFRRSVFFSLAGLITVFVLYFFDYRQLKKYSVPIYASTMLLLLYTMIFGVQAQGARSWLNFGPFSINFTAASPLFFMIALAGIFDEWDWNNSYKLLQGLGLIAAPLLLFLAVPAIPTGFIYIVVCLVLMLVSGAKLRQALLLPGLLSGFLLLAILAVPYRLARLLIFLNPGSDPDGNGYLNMQLNRMLSASGLWGQGLTFEPQILPGLHTDFIFTFITYTLGWATGILLAALITAFLARVASMSKQVKGCYAACF